ncbi:MAG: heme biosynthesis HemY N-terminal domain-containing protein, partial [Methylocella sp.]
MVRVVFFLVVLIALVFGVDWLVDRPGEVTLNWQGYRIETSFLVALGIVLAVFAALAAAWYILSSSLRFPSSVSAASRARRRERGFAALSQGIIAVGAGDARVASKAAAELQKQLPDEPLTLLLTAEAAQLTGDHRAVEAAFQQMTRRDHTRLLG